MNHIGQPICINEYATDIAEGPNSHVMHFNDFNPENDHISQEHIDMKENFQEFILKKRTGRACNSFIPECNI